MKVFIAGGTGVIGIRVVRLLAGAGHDVVGTTRSAERTSIVDTAGGRGIVCDILDRAAMVREMTACAPDVALHLVTDLPDKASRLPLKLLSLNKTRTAGTDNFLAAASAAGVNRVIAQSVGFPLPGVAQKAVDHLEREVLAAGGTVLRYAPFYGEGTWNESAPSKGAGVQIDYAAERTVELLDAPAGVIEVADPVSPRGSS